MAAPTIKYSIMTIVVLGKSDYIINDGVKYEFNDAYTNMNFDGFIEFLRDVTIKYKQSMIKIFCL